MSENPKTNEQTSPLMKQTPRSSPILTQIGVANMALNDFLNEVYKTVKMIADDNTALVAENAELKAKLTELKP